MPEPVSPPPTTPPAPAARPDGSAPAGARAPLLARLTRYRRLWIVATIVYGLDQLTKLLVAARIPYPTYGPPGHHEVIPGFFNLVHVGNTGAAWSILSGRGPWLAALAVFTLFAVYYWRHSLGLRHRTAQLCFGGFCGGAVGNLTDRIAHGHVIDFLDFHFGAYAYPSFNVADIGIVCGVLAYVVWSFRQPEEPEGGSR